MSILPAAIAAAAIVAAAVVWAGARIARALEHPPAGAAPARTLALLELFAPAWAAADADPRALLAWQPLARAARQLYAEDFAALDRASGGTFPFTADQIQAAHGRWTADWLAWERAHDAEYKLKAAAAEQEFEASGGALLARAKLDAVEREKLDLYQRRYQEYVQVAKALQRLQSS